jgi:hypothetical protein
MSEPMTTSTNSDICDGSSTRRFRGTEAVSFPALTGLLPALGERVWPIHDPGWEYGGMTKPCCAPLRDS